MKIPDKTKFGPVKEASNKVNGQYRHLNSFLSKPSDKIIFMHKMNFTPVQICKKLGKSYLFVMNTITAYKRTEDKATTQNGGPK